MIILLLKLLKFLLVWIVDGGIIWSWLVPAKLLMGGFQCHLLKSMLFSSQDFPTVIQIVYPSQVFGFYITGIHTNSDRVQRKLSSDDFRLFAGNIRNLLHLLRDCPRALLIWKQISSPTPILHPLLFTGLVGWLPMLTARRAVTEAQSSIFVLRLEVEFHLRIHILVLREMEEQNCFPW